MLTGIVGRDELRVAFNSSLLLWRGEAIIITTNCFTPLAPMRRALNLITGKHGEDDMEKPELQEQGPAFCFLMGYGENVCHDFIKGTDKAAEKRILSLYYAGILNLC